MAWNTRKGHPKVDRKTHEIDAAGKVVGRIASDAARYLIGKHKASYVPHFDMGDFVVIRNAAKAEFTGRKWEQKQLYHSSNRPGGVKATRVSMLRKEKPELILEHAIKYMIPKNKLQRDRMKRLTITA
jgi:large subunit ribosomal protein L13